jgi:hypothetical protein
MERAKIEDLLSVYKFSTVPFTYNKNKQNCGASEKRDGNCHLLAKSRWAILSCLLLADARNLGIS